MITARELEPLREVVGKARSAGRLIGLVPTMGALHEGHLSLVRRARRECGFTVVSIFVNPLQFGPNEDFARYPRQPEKDGQMLEREGVDLLYLPEPEGFYPAGFSTFVEVGDVSDGGEGAMRPGHFRGVATVVAKLFLQVQPDVAFFGRKDLQQLAVVRRMARDLDFPLRVEAGETVREPDGLALSSRNAYLSPEERRRAALLPRALFAARDRAAAGETDARAIERQTREELERGGLTVDYVEVVDPETMRRKEIVEPRDGIAAAIRLGKTRLIDNVLIHGKR
ncbi:MAG: pantoate--beta-alanine ligase [Thermoanaerobaculia bacterium]